MNSSENTTPDGLLGLLAMIALVRSVTTRSTSAIRGWNDPSLGTEPTVVGGWFAAPDPGPRAEFAQKFAALTGRRPHGFASLGYDAGALAAVLARGEHGPDFSIAALTAEHGYAGVDGIIRFLPSGLSERGLAVLEMQRNEFKVQDPAPTSFAKPAY